MRVVISAIGLTTLFWPFCARTSSGMMFGTPSPIKLRSMEAIRALHARPRSRLRD